MTPKDIISDVRPQNDDAKGAAQKWEDTDFIREIEAGINYLYTNASWCRVKSDAVTLWTNPCTLTPGNVDQVLPISDVYRGPLVEWCLYRYYSSDAGDQRDEVRADEHWKRFTQLVFGK